jgi:hypothetical protein
MTLFAYPSQVTTVTYIRPPIEPAERFALAVWAAHESGRPYLAMRLIDGTSHSHYLFHRT